MLDNFHLAAIVKRRRDDPSLLQIPLSGELQKDLAATWTAQMDSFLDEIEPVEFDPGYQPERHERFRIADYELPDWLADESSLTLPDLDRMDKNQASVNSIAGTVGMARDEQGDDLMMFQNFTSSRVIRPGRILFLEGNTYEGNDRPGMTLDTVLSAMYRASSGELLFRNFRTVNTFLPLANYFEEASRETILEVLDHYSLEVANAEAVSIHADQWTRKRFALLKDSGILDRYSPEQLKDFSEGYDASIETDENGRILFPDDKAEMKRVLQFLVEERFIGAITQTLYETNSKKRAS